MVKSRRLRNPEIADYDRLHLGLHSGSNLTHRKNFSPRTIIENFNLAERFPGLARAFGGIGKVRVLEVGAFSGRLTERMVKMFGLNPKNYVIGDIDYPVRENGTGPRLVKQPFLWVKSGLMKKLHLDLLKPAPEGIGRFHLIIIPNVFRLKPRESSARLTRIQENYLPFLEVGGSLMMNRVNVNPEEKFRVYYPDKASFSPGAKYSSTIEDGLLTITRIN